ncbi:MULTISPECIES: type IV toxin-antitoxin system AbiEi family antitoxin domain-containing protein [Chryseobacterium]|uniref:AbiEi antitoxin C-terminal domain-containing protein n=1 Tax=Chryseobacterium sediminis TaxID=1679494 RepID=A0A5B2U3Z1_9FLAO|nr:MULTISPECIES: hypothetical protein [Chryseobacterium]KAA2221411.1 hypothetical protein FW780_14075 [Chryseobacterium sediminis]TLX27594.1 hypothetical protein FE904_00965 [Chryseobacterium indologenes]UOU99242.1 hypothetical protein MUU74_04610 [Chryseobacterium daecheongense]
MAKFEKYTVEIEDALEENDYKVLTTEEFERLVSSIKQIKGIKSASRKKIKEFLLEHYIVQNRLQGQSNSEFYYLKDSKIDQYDIASTRSRSAFFSHYSALAIHNLTIQLPKQVYLTWERKGLRHQNDTFLIQENVDIAFSKTPRITQDKRKYKGFTINFINGQNHNLLGIEPFRNKYLVSNIERTLIDVSVRPFYAGGITQVLQSFEEAKDKLNTQKLFDYYVEMDFTYPYHKVIGFYLEKAGYNEKDYEPFLNMDSDIDFYLTYNILHKDYNSKWKLFIPKGL